jgi:hypothetical protein
MEVPVTLSIFTHWTSWFFMPVTAMSVLSVLTLLIVFGSVMVGARIGHKETRLGLTFLWYFLLYMTIATIWQIRAVADVAMGTLAPSGENAQPWRFKVAGDTIELHNNPNSDQSPYNWGQRASYLSNGAALENMLIAASALGCRVNTKLFPDLSNPNLVAELELQKTQMVTDKLYPFIDGRVTNRKPYSNEALTREQIEYLSRTSSDVGYGSEIFFTQDEEAKKVLGRAGGTNEEVMMWRNMNYLSSF